MTQTGSGTKVADNKGSFNPERVEVPEELQEEQALSSEVEEIFEEDTAFSDLDEALAAMEFYDSPDETE